MFTKNYTVMFRVTFLFTTAAKGVIMLANEKVKVYRMHMTV